MKFEDKDSKNFQSRKAPPPRTPIEVIIIIRGKFYGLKLVHYGSLCLISENM